MNLEVFNEAWRFINSCRFIAKIVDIEKVDRKNTEWKSDFWFSNDPDQKPLMYIEVIYISFGRAHRIASNEVSFIGGSIKGENR